MGDVPHELAQFSWFFLKRDDGSIKVAVCLLPPFAAVIAFSLKAMS